MKIPLWSFHVSMLTFITLTPVDSTRLTKITKSSANSFLRQKRANKGFFSEIFKTADLQRECQDNTCSTEEFNEVANKHLSNQDWTEEVKRSYQQKLFDPCARGSYIENGRRIEYKKSKIAASPCYLPSLKQCKSKGTNFTCVLYSSWSFIPECENRIDQAGRRKVCENNSVHPLTRTCFDKLKNSGNLKNYFSASYEQSLKLLSTIICENDACYEEMISTENWGKCEPVENFVHNEENKIAVTKECLSLVESNINKVIYEKNFDYTYETYECYKSLERQSPNFEICSGSKNIISTKCAKELGHEIYFSEYASYLSAIFKSAINNSNCQNDVLENEGCGLQTRQCDEHEAYSISDVCLKLISQSEDDRNQYCENQEQRGKLLFHYEDCIDDLLDGIKCISSSDDMFCDEREAKSDSDHASSTNNSSYLNKIKHSTLPSVDVEGAGFFENPFGVWIIVLAVILMAVAGYVFRERIKSWLPGSHDRTGTCNKELDPLTPGYT